MSLEEARDALGRADFVAALAVLGEQPAEPGEAAAWLECRAQAAYGAGEYDGAVAAWEELHRYQRERGERIEAARAAVMVAVFLLVDSGLMSAVRGWARRAERLLEGRDPTPVHALIAAVRGYAHFFTGDMDAAAAQAAQAVELGERLDVMPAVTIGRTALGRVAVLNGDIDTGFGELDEVAALLMSGEVDDLTTGMMFCELICAAQGVADTERAREWTEAMERWAPDGAFGSIRGRCRVHRAELMRLSGPCDAAEREILQACAELRPWMRREFGWPLAELGTIRLRRGDLVGAEESFLACDEHAWPPNPGLALLRLEQGDVETAAELIDAAISHPVDTPSKEMPPFGDLRLAPLLDAAAEIAAVAGDRETLEDASDALREIARRYANAGLTAAADLAAARLSLMSGDAAQAVSRAQAALVGYTALGAKFDVGRARTVLADAYALDGREHAARLERSSAHQAYATYGAPLRAAAVAVRHSDDELSVPPSRSDSAGVSGVFRPDGPTWLVGLDGVQARVKDLKGVRYLHRLVSEPGREFHVLDLVAVENGTLRRAAVEGTADLTQAMGERGLPVLDAAARDAYRRRLADADEDIEEASQLNDLGRLAKAEADRDYLIAELRRAIGFGDRQRLVGGSSERARTSVARAVRYALTEITRHHAAFAQHLRASLHTGTYCCYEPDPFVRIDWDL